MILSSKHDVAEHGFCHLRQIWSPNEVRLMADAVQAALADTCDASGVRVFHPRDCSPLLRQHLLGGALAQAITEIIGPAEFLSMKPVSKDPAHAFATPWHQDRPYWGGVSKWSVWIALDDVAVANGCLRVIPGSHHQLATHQRPSDPRPGFEHRLIVDEERAHDVILRAGDAILFHDLLIHASHPCHSGGRRLALIPTYRQRGVADSSTIWPDPQPLLRDFSPSAEIKTEQFSVVPGSDR